MDGASAQRLAPGGEESAPSKHSYLQRAYLPFAAAACALLAPFLNFLHYHEYPVASAEVALIVLGMLAIAAAVALLYPGQRIWGSIFLEILLIVVAVDLTTDSYWIPAIAGVLALAFFLLRKSSLLPFISIMGVVVIATGFMDSRSTGPGSPLRRQTSRCQPNSRLPCFTSFWTSTPELNLRVAFFICTTVGRRVDAVLRAARLPPLRSSL